MRHAVAGYQLSRTKNERRRLLQGLARELIVRGSIRTTLAKAKAVQPMVEKLVTHARVGSAESIKRVLSDWQSTRLLLSDAKTRFGTRTSGFTRIMKLGGRAGDSAEKALLQFVDPRVIAEIKPVEKKTK
ncbi:50S ribosomal protein L17 [Candidatus Gottesmanbacteria bacterium]|nr:50S ribosomal protein L17 [Candidatus Gottesmanbacteria bacterium]